MTRFNIFPSRIGYFTAGLWKSLKSSCLYTFVSRVGSRKRVYVISSVWAVRFKGGGKTVYHLPTARFNFDKFLFVGIRLVSTCYIWWHFIHLYKGILEIDLTLVKFQCLELISLILYFTCILICIFHLLNPMTFLFWEWEEFEEGKGKSDEAETHAKSRELLENFLWTYKKTF